MEALEIKTRTTDVGYIFLKMMDTISVYRERYPELGYIKSSITNFQGADGTEISIDLLEKINRYMKDQLSEYYAIRIMQHKFQEDINALKAGITTSKEAELYLNFAG